MSEAPALAADAVARTTRAAVLGAIAALVALGLLWELRLAPTGSGTLALKVLPLLLPLPGVLAWRLRSFRALSLLVWLYVAEGALRAASERGLAVQLASLELALCAALFAACVLHVRRRTRDAAWRA